MLSVSGGKDIFKLKIYQTTLWALTHSFNSLSFYYKRQFFCAKPNIILIYTFEADSHSKSLQEMTLCKKERQQLWVVTMTIIVLFSSY